MIRKGKFDTFCSSEWPAFGVGWHLAGSLSRDVIAWVKGIVTQPRKHRYPDQIPYIRIWEVLLDEPPEWLAPFLNPNTPLPVLALESQKTSAESRLLYPCLSPLNICLHRNPSSQNHNLPFSMISRWRSRDLPLMLPDHNA